MKLAEPEEEHTPNYTSPTLSPGANFSPTPSLVEAVDNAIMQNELPEKLFDEFMGAVANGDQEKVQLLLEKGVNINNWDPQYSVTAVQLAVTDKKFEMAKFLVKQGASTESLVDDLVKAVEDEDRDLVNFLLELGVDVNGVDDDGFTPLRMAARIGNAELTRILLEKGANVNSKDQNDWTALHELVHGSKDMDTLEVLLKFGADPTLQAKRMELDTTIQGKNVRASGFDLEDVPEVQKRLLEAEKEWTGKELAKLILNSTLSYKETKDILELFRNQEAVCKLGFVKNDNNDPKIEKENNKIIEDSVKNLLEGDSPNSNVQNPSKKRKLNPEIEKS